MSTLTTTPVQVYLLTEGWNFSVSTTSISGTRVYLETDQDLVGVTKVDLPRVGSPWDDDYPNVTLKTIDKTLVANSEQCGYKHTCTYDGVPFGQEAVPLAKETDVPRSVEVGGEYITWVEPGTNGAWYWLSDTAKVEQAMSRIVALANFRMYRVIKNEDIDEYMVTVMGIVNKLNDKDFLGFPKEMVMFTGSSMSEFKNRTGDKRWRVELNFSVRSVTRNFTAGNDGWNWILRIDKGTWDKPWKNLPTSNIYPLGDFSTLFATHALGADENLFQVTPEK